MSLTTAAETSHLRAGHPASYFRLRHAPADGANYGLLNHAVHRASIATPAAYTLYDAGAFPVAVTGGATALVGNVFDVEAATFVRVDALENRPVDYDQFVITTAAGSLWLYRWQRALDPVWPACLYRLIPASSAIMTGASWRCPVIWAAYWFQAVLYWRMRLVGASSQPVWSRKHCARPKTGRPAAQRLR